jgi:hypothetical protein
MMARTRELEASQNKSVGDLATEALWFAIHSFLAIFILALVWAAITFSQPDPDSLTPKIFATALAFIVPLVGGFIVARIRPRDRRIQIAPYVWISGLLLFAAVCVWVLDLPTGPGLCESCGAVDKLWRTFFDINHGSGLMGGDGLLVGAWAPLSLFGYAAGAALALGI